MERCRICGEFYDPRFLSQVAEHMHAGVELDKEYYGKKVDEDANARWLQEKLKEIGYLKDNDNAP